MTEGLSAVRDLAHGTELAFRAGCRSRGGCVNRDSARLLTCAEAVVARRSDYHLGKLPMEQAVPRTDILDSAQAESARSTAKAGSKPDGPPPGPSGLDSPGAPRAEGAEVAPSSRPRATRGRNARAPLRHGTSTGYLRGCRGAECPGDERGTTCREARNRTRQRLARRRGVVPRPAAVDAAPAADRISQLRASGLSIASIANMLGVGRTTLANICNGTTERIWPNTLAAILSFDFDQVSHLR